MQIKVSGATSRDGGELVLPGKANHEPLQRPLQKRVDDYLRYQISGFIVEVIEDEASNVILDQIREAEREIEAMHNRLARLKDILAKLHRD